MPYTVFMQHTFTIFFCHIFHRGHFLDNASKSIDIFPMQLHGVACFMNVVGHECIHFHVLLPLLSYATIVALSGISAKRESVKLSERQSLRAGYVINLE